MRFTIAAAAAALVATASAQNGTVLVTEVVSQYTTVCPAATELTYNGQVYTATASETLTITNCPCTVTHPVGYATPAVSAPAAAPPAATVPAASVPAAAPPAVSAAPPAAGNYAAGNGSTGAYASPAASTTAPVQFTGAANKLSGAGAGLAAIFAVAAYAL